MNNPRLFPQGKIPILLLVIIGIISGCAGKANRKALFQRQGHAALSQVPVVDVREKKIRFFAYLRPVIVAENNRIMKQRQRLLRLKSNHDAGQQMAGEKIAWLRQLADEYNVEDNITDNRFWLKLVIRVDLVPVELALAQAANESSWGESRFAREGNNYFGQWCYVRGCGIVPKRRKADASHEVAVFESARESVRSYFHNLNTGRAYRRLRLIRFRARQQGRNIRATELANGLVKYSSRGKDYVRDIQQMIRVNRPLMLALAKA